MKKPRIKRPKISSKVPGATPKGTHPASISIPKGTHNPGKNLGKYLHKEKPSKLGPAKKIGNVAAVAKAIKSNKRKPGYD